MVFGGVVSRDGLGLGRIGAPGYREHRSVSMAPMFKGIRFGRHHFCSEVWEVVSKTRQFNWILIDGDFDSGDD